MLRQKIDVDVPYLSEVRSFSGPDRDPRGWSIGMLYFALLPRDHINAVVKDSVDEVAWVNASQPRGWPLTTASSSSRQSNG